MTADFSDLWMQLIFSDNYTAKLKKPLIYLIGGLR